MADDHASVVEFDVAYNQQVVFIVGSMESLLENQDSNNTGHSVLHRDAGEEESVQSEAMHDSGQSMATETDSSCQPRKLRKRSHVEHSHDEEEGDSSHMTCKMEEKDSSANVVVKSESPSSQQPFSKENIMKQFEETEKLFQEQVLGKKPIKQRQPPNMKSKTQPVVNKSHVSKPPATIASVGMEHLDLLVKLMEQLSHLKEENSQLRHKCSYLDDTQSLLRMQNRMLLSAGHMGKDVSRWKVKSHLQQSHKGSVRKKKVEDTHESDSSDMDDFPESRKKLKLMHHRSQSVGSIHIDLEVGATANKDVKSPEKTKDGSRFETMFSKSKITSKWERVKKVFSGKPEPSSKAEHSTITAEQLVRANSKHSMALLTSGQQLQPLPAIPNSRSSDNGSMSGLRPDSPENRDYRLLRPLSTGDSSHQPPPSPSSVQSEPMIPSVITSDDIYEEVDLPVSGGLAPPDLDYHGSSGISSFTGDDGEVRVTASKDYSSSDEPRSPQFLSVQDSQMMKRRQSSPALSLCDESEFHNMDLDGRQGSSKLGRSHSFKTSKSDVETTPGEHGEGTESYHIRRKHKYKSSKTAWSRVKDIIHTRKDSLKRKNKRSNSAGDSLPDGSTSDGEFFCFRYDYEDIEQWEHETSGSPKLVRKGSLRGCESSSPKTPTLGEREPRYKSPSDSPPPKKKDTYGAAVSAPSSPPQHVDVSALIGTVSDDFNKKIQEWEDKKRKSIYREYSCTDDEDSQRRAEAAKFTDEFIRKMEEWERIKGLSSRKSRGSGKLSQSPVGANSPEEQPPSMEELQKHLSESFGKTVKEWQKIKESRIKDSGSPIPESGPRGISRSRKQDRSKSRERDRSRHKYERQREKELQKIEKKEHKIEKEKEKLEMMKKKLGDIETMSEAEVRGLTKEFARKLHEWEVMKGTRQKDPADEVMAGVLTSQQSSTELLPQGRFGVHVRSNSAKQHRETLGKGEQGKGDSLKRERAQSEYGRRERTYSEGKNNTSASALLQDTLEGSTDSKLTERSQRSSSVPLLSQSSNLVDDSTSIDLNLTSETVHTLEETNKRLIDDLQEKEEDVMLLNDEIQQLTERINMMNKEQSRQIELYKRELWGSSRLGRHTIENDLVSASIRELGDTVDQINRQQKEVLAEKQKLKVQLEDEIAARHAAEAEVIDRLQQIHKLGTSGPQEGLQRFCEFFKKLQEQLSELKLGVTERNHLVYKLHHQLVTQEVQNRLLQTDLQRTHMQVDFLQDAKAKGTIRRVKTFGGVDYITRGEGAVKCKHRRSGRLSRHKKPTILSRDLLQDLHHALHLSVQPEWDWLHRLHHYENILQGALCTENEESQTETRGADVSVQTVMTLCKVPYNVPQPHQTTASSKTTVTALTSVTAGVTPVTSVRPATVYKGTQTDDLPSTTKNVMHTVSVISQDVTASSTTFNAVPSSPCSASAAVTPEVMAASPSVNAASPKGTFSVAGNTSPTSQLTSSNINVTSTSVSGPSTVINRSQIIMGGRMHQHQQQKQQQLVSITNAQSMSKSPKAPHVVRVLQSSQQLQNAQNNTRVLKAPPKPPRRRMVPRMIDPVSTSPSVQSTANSEVNSNTNKPGEPSSKPVKVIESRTVDNEDMTLTFSVQKVQNNSACSENSEQKRTVQKSGPVSQGSSDTDEVFTDNKSSQQPPYSPIIRSRYPRKLRSEAKMIQLYSDNRQWKATPPKRMIRHRKAATEKRAEETTTKPPDDIMSRSQEQPIDEVPDTSVEGSRSLPCDLRDINKSLPDTEPRVHSDCYPVPSKDSLAPPIEHYMNNDYLRGRYRFRYQREMQRLPVQDIISRFETVNAVSPTSPSSSPPRTDMTTDGRKSPIQRPIQSPVHKLKTAQELLVEHEAKWNSQGGRRRSSSANRAETVTVESQKGRLKISSTSSDKENEHATTRQRERTPPVRTTQGEVIKQVVQRLASPTRESPAKPPLKDLTNGGKVKHIKDTLNERSTPERSLPSSPGKRQSELPPGGTVLKRSELFQSGEISKARSGSSSPGSAGSPRIVRSDTGINDSSINSLDASEIHGPWDLQPGAVAAATAASPSSMSSSYPPNTPPSSPSSPASSVEKRFQRLFGKKIHLSSSPSSSSQSLQSAPAAAVQSSPQPSASQTSVTASPKTGAISMLCRQALVVNLEQVELGPDDPGSEGGQDSPATHKKGVGKLLDRHWLQKPKRFFKVSK